MICLNDTDTLEAGASVDAVVDYTVHGLVGSTFTNIAQGQLSNVDPTVLYTAAAAISIVSIILVNTHSAAVTVNLYLDPADAGTPRRMIPKNVSLGIGYSLHFDGQRISIMDPAGGIAYSYIAHTHDGDTLQLDGISSDGGAFPFTTSAKVTFSQNIDFAGQLGFPATANPSANVNCLDDYEEGYYTATLTCGTSGTITINASYDQLAYTKIGRLVTVTGAIAVGSVDSPVGSLTLNLPFPLASLTEIADQSSGIIVPNNINALDAAGALALLIAASGAVIVEKTTTTLLNDVANHMKANADLYFNFYYFTD